MRKGHLAAGTRLKLQRAALRPQEANLVAVDPCATSSTFVGPIENPLVPKKLKSKGAGPAKWPQSRCPIQIQLRPGLIVTPFRQEMGRAGTGMITSPWTL